MFVDLTLLERTFGDASDSSCCDAFGGLDNSSGASIISTSLGLSMTSVVCSGC